MQSPRLGRATTIGLLVCLSATLVLVVGSSISGRVHFGLTAAKFVDSVTVTNNIFSTGFWDEDDDDDDDDDDDEND